MTSKNVRLPSLPPVDKYVSLFLQSILEIMDLLLSTVWMKINTTHVDYCLSIPGFQSKSQCFIPSLQKLIPKITLKNKMFPADNPLTNRFDDN